MKLGLRTAVGAVAAVVALGAAPSAMAQAGHGCTLDGQAKFSTGLNTTAKDFNYTFTGDLANCQSLPASNEASGKVIAGVPINVGGVEYATPVPSGNGGCMSSTTSGTAIVTWASGARTIVNYTTSGVLAAVALQGSVVPSLTLTATDGSGRTTTITSNKFQGYGSAGPVLFDPPDPAACNTATGVLQARIIGFLGLGTD